MAYFDSPKNKAFWERELAGLRKEKERRALEGYDPQKEKAPAKRENTATRKLVTLAQLEKEEMAERGIKRVKIPSPSIEKQKTLQKEKELEGRSL